MGDRVVGKEPSRAGRRFTATRRARGGSPGPSQDPEILQLGLLFLLAPIGMILGLVAGVRGAPKWLIGIVEVASLPLLIVGTMAGSAV